MASFFCINPVLRSVLKARNVKTQAGASETSGALNFVGNA